MLQPNNSTPSYSKEDKEAVDILVKEISRYINQLNIKSDITFKSVVKAVNSKGYVILDQSGCERTVKCVIPGVELRPGQGVWVKLPCGKLNDAHICGVVAK